MFKILLDVGLFHSNYHSMARIFSLIEVDLFIDFTSMTRPWTEIFVQNKNIFMNEALLFISKVKSGHQKYLSKFMKCKSTLTIQKYYDGSTK